MAYHNRQYKRRLSLAHANNALILLIAINLIIFVILAFLKAVFYLNFEGATQAAHSFNTNVLNYFTLPADVNKIASRPWTILTYMLHTSVYGTCWVICSGFGYLDIFFLILRVIEKLFPSIFMGLLPGPFHLY